LQMFILCKVLIIYCLQIPSTEIDKSADKFFSYWDPDKKSYIVSLSIHVLQFCLAAFISKFHNLQFVSGNRCNYISSQDHQRLTDNQQLLGLSQMGQEALLVLLRQGHHPIRRHCRHLHRMHLWGCPIGSRRHQ
jgi:hypothetical protein